MRDAVHPVPDTVAETQLDGVLLAEDERPTCTAAPDGETVPVNAKAVPAVPVVGGLTSAIDPEDPPAC